MNSFEEGTEQERELGLSDLVLVLCVVMKKCRNRKMLEIFRYWVTELGSCVINGGDGNIKRIAEHTGFSHRQATRYVQEFSSDPVIGQILKYKKNRPDPNLNTTQ